MKNLGIYIHIPFCIKKCLYCDFLSFENTEKSAHTKYIEALVREIEYYGKLYGKNVTVDSVFIGGGTPTLIEANLISYALNSLRKYFMVSGDAEITIECNPKTISEEKLLEYRKSGINRISIGVQTLDDSTLKSLGRVHRALDAEETYKLAREYGFQNINLDLMFAVPGHKMATWIETLNKAILLEPEHISFYSLQLEEGTRFFEMYQNEEFEMVSEKIDREMYHHAVNFLTGNGYHHYEISNCAKVGFECKHNLKYWSLENYLGLGIGAHSFIDGTRFSNTRQMEKYISALNEPMNSNLPGNAQWVDWLQTNSKQDQIVDFMITGLRKTQGIDLNEFKSRFGVSLFEAYQNQEKQIIDYIKNGFMVMEENMLRFTVKGIDISNTVLSEFV
ncbi:MAG: radical SAM family heme chaperone HemW [Aminipila sp.]